MKKSKERHSKQRHKFQKSYVDMLVYTMSIEKLIEFFKIKTRTQLYRLTDKELIDLINKLSDDGAYINIYPLTQWEDFIDFVEYVKGESK